MERLALALALLLLPALLAPSRAAEDCDIDTVDGSALSAADFQSRYVRGSRPVRLTGLGGAWAAAAEAWREPAALGRLYRGQPLVSRWADGAYLFGLMVRPVTMDDFLSSMAHKRAGLLFNSSRVGEGELWSAPRLISDAGMTEPIISVGPAGRGLGFHSHGSTFEALLAGRKRVALLPPISAATIAAAADRCEQ